jgi:hypothetical protein
MNKMVLGVFHDRTHAEDGISELERLGYNPKDISIVMRDQGQAEELAADTGADVVGGATTGAVTGGALGALAGLLVANGILPGLGTVLIGGPIAAALGLTGAAATAVSGAATGALAGSLVGALSGFGLSDEEARVYEQSILDGGILVAVPTDLERQLEVQDTLESFGADQIRVITSEDTATTRARMESRETGRGAAYFSEVRRKRRK